MYAGFGLKTFFWAAPKLLESMSRNGDGIYLNTTPFRRVDSRLDFVTFERSFFKIDRPLKSCKVEKKMDIFTCKHLAI